MPTFKHATFRTKTCLKPRSVQTAHGQQNFEIKTVAFNQSSRQTEILIPSQSIFISVHATYVTTHPKNPKISWRKDPIVVKYWEDKYVSGINAGQSNESETYVD